MGDFMQRLMDIFYKNNDKYKGIHVSKRGNVRVDLDRILRETKKKAT